MLGTKTARRSGGFTLAVPKGWELRSLFIIVALVFVAFFAVPLVLVLGKSFVSAEGAATLGNYAEVLSSAEFGRSIVNSLAVSLAAAGVSVVLAFLLAYTVNCTNLPSPLRRALSLLAQMPMLLPTITYGFAIIYSFGRQGFLTELFGFQLFDVYGFNGLLIGYVIYTLPTAFLLINNSFQFVDKRFMIVSRIMGDKPFATFVRTVVRPLLGALCTAFILSFFLSFTDYGIPTSVGGKYDVVALQLYNQMLGSVPDFNKGAVIAVVMLVPSVISIVAMAVIDRHAIRYDKISPIEIPRSTVRDVACGIASILVVVGVLSVFAVILIVPFMEMWPFKPYPTLDHVATVFTDSGLADVFTNSLGVSAATAFIGCLVAYAAALVTSRSDLAAPAKRAIDSVSSIVNTVPGMVLGVAYLFAFTGSPLQSTFAILVICNIVHYFATPYQMMKDSLSKMNASWETTARLMGDTWIKTIVRIVTPNAWPTLLQVFGYYFVNAMVTISAVVFLTGAHTMVVTTKISALQHVADFDSIFVLSLFILVINLAVKGVVALATRERKPKRKASRGKAAAQAVKPSRVGVPEARFDPRRAAGVVLALIVVIGAVYVGTAGDKEQSDKAVTSTEGKIVIASNADDEAIAAYKHALDANGFAGKYLIQSFGTSELGGKLMAEGSAIEADVVTMSSYYLDSAQQQNGMFADLVQVTSQPLSETPSYRRPAQAQEGAIFYNSEVLAAEGLPVPTSLKDLADPVYEGMISLPDINGSSTGWLLVQSLIGAYGEDKARDILTGMYRNAGPYLSQSGSAPIKNVRVGEVAIGFGLRHQAVADKADGLPIEVVDPAEGNYVLTESVAVVGKGVRTNPDAQRIAAVIIDAGRPELMQTYSTPLYVGESTGSDARDFKEFGEPLTVDLLKQHQALSEECKRAADGA